MKQVKPDRLLYVVDKFLQGPLNTFYVTQKVLLITLYVSTFLLKDDVTLTFF